MGSWYSNPGTGASGSISVGGVGKYLKARSNGTEMTTVNGQGQDSKKRKTDVSNVEYKDFSGW